MIPAYKRALRLIDLSPCQICFISKKKLRVPIWELSGNPFKTAAHKFHMNCIYIFVKGWEVQIVTEIDAIPFTLFGLVLIICNLHKNKASVCGSMNITLYLTKFSHKCNSLLHLVTYSLISELHIVPVSLFCHIWEQIKNILEPNFGILSTWFMIKYL